MKLTITDQAAQRLAPYMDEQHKILLSFDDGVGPFSDLGFCSLEVSFDVIVVDADTDVPDYQGVLETNHGNWYYKPYSAPQFDEHMKLDFVNNSLTLSGDSGMIDNNAEIKVMTKTK